MKITAVGIEVETVSGHPNEKGNVHFANFPIHLNLIDLYYFLL